MVRNVLIEWIGRLVVFIARWLPPGLLVMSVRQGDGRSVLGSIARRLLRVLRTSDVVIPHGPAAGLRFNAGGSAPSFALGTTEPEVQAVLSQLLRPGDVFYDIGANVGFYTLLASKLVKSHGRVYAFEPVPGNVRAIHHNLKLSSTQNVDVIPYAVADHSGSFSMMISAEPFWSRFSGLPSPPHPSGTIEVRGITIDDLVVEKSILPPNVIKLDVEGAEEQVLAGMRQTIRAHHPVIVCELHDTWSEVRPLLDEVNYNIIYLWRQVRGRTQRSRHIVAFPEFEDIARVDNPR